MKQKVRLYRAQMGTQTNPSMMGYPGAQQGQGQQAAQVTQEELISIVTNDISQEVPQEQTVYKLMNAYPDTFNNPMEVKQFVDSIYASLQKQKEAQKAILRNEEEIEEDPAQELAGQTMATGEEDEEQDYSQYYNNETSPALAQMGAQVDNNISYAGLESYMPDNYTNLMGYDTFKQGGSKNGKRDYVRSVMRLVKKQLGGQEEESSDVDPIGQDVRTNTLKNFISGVKRDGDLSLAKQYAKEAYDNNMQNNMREQGGMADFTSYTHGDTDIFHDQMNEIVRAQYGGLTGRQQRQLQKSMARMPFLAKAGPMTKLDVTKSGLFGRPRRYSAEFASPLQQIAGTVPSVPGTTPGRKPGVITTTTKKIPGKEEAKKEDEAKKEALPTAAETEGGTGGGSGGSGGGSSNTGGGSSEENTVDETTPAAKKLKPTEYQYISGKPFVYRQKPDGTWVFKSKDKDDKWNAVTNQESLAQLGAGESKSAMFVKLDSKPGFYYRKKNDGSYVKYKGDFKNHTESKQPVMAGGKPIVIKPGDETYNYLNTKSTSYVKPFIPKAPAVIKQEKEQIKKEEEEKVKFKTQQDQLRDILQMDEIEAYDNLPWYEKPFQTRPGLVTGMDPGNRDDYVGQYVLPFLGAPGYNISNFRFNQPATNNPMLGPGQGMLNQGQPMLNQGQRMLNQGQGMLNPGQGMLNPGQGMLNPGQGMLNPPAGFQYKLPFQAGGMTNGAQMDMYGNLQKFTGGGYGINQDDIDYMYSKDTSDPYFQTGGTKEFKIGDQTYTITDNPNAKDNTNENFMSSIYAQFAPKPIDKEDIEQTDTEKTTTNNQTNLAFNTGNKNPMYAGSWNKVTQTAYDPKTGKSYGDIMPFGDKTSVAKLDVTKSGRYGPKKYSVTYNNPSMAQTPVGERKLAPAGSTPAPAPAPGTNQQANSRFSNTEGLNAFTRGKVAFGEAQANRQMARGERRLGTPEEQAREYEKANPMAKMQMKPFSQMPRIPYTTTGPLKTGKAQYGGYTQYAGGNEVTTPVDQDERFEPLPIRSAQPAMDELRKQREEVLATQGKFQETPEQFTVDYKVKNAFNVNYPMALNAGNTIGSTLAKYIEGPAENTMPLTAEEYTGSTPRRFEGNIDTNTGLMRPDAMSNNRNSAFVAQMGGAMEGEEIYMTDQEIEEFLANGGELEYL